MFIKRKFILVLLALLVNAPFSAYANNNSTRIGLSVEIKPKQACHFSYVLESDVNLSRTRTASQSSCLTHVSNIQQQANIVATTMVSNSAESIDGKKLRVLMVVQ